VPTIHPDGYDIPRQPGQKRACVSTGHPNRSANWGTDSKWLREGRRGVRSLPDWRALGSGKALIIVCVGNRARPGTSRASFGTRSATIAIIAAVALTSDCVSWAGSTVP
jgi:hypothetical protein